MKKVVLFLIFLFLLQIISAVEVNMKENYFQGETLLAKISGNFAEPILKENVFFYRQRANGSGFLRIPINNFDITIIDEEYYIYAKLPESPNNYKISIEDVKYYKGSSITDENIEKNFTITNQTADFSIDKGVINTNQDFSINVQNLQEFKITLKINTKTNSGSSDDFLSSLFGNIEEGEENTISLKSGEIKKIDFQVKNIYNSTFKTIEISSDNLKYEIPVYIFANAVVPSSKEKSMKFDPPYLNVQMTTDYNSLKYVYLKNTGNEILKNITLYFSDNLKNLTSTSISEIDELKPNSSIKLELFFYSGSYEEIIEGYIKAKEKDVRDFLDISINVTKSYVPPPEENKTTIKRPCSLLNGKFCNEEQKCSGEEKESIEGKCCVGECVKKPAGSTSQIIGWFLIVAVIIFLLWFFAKKYRRAKKPFDLLERAEKGNKNKL